MKPILTLCICMLAIISVATAQSKKGYFVRIFDEKEMKTHKGNLKEIGDSTLTIMFQKKLITIRIAEISTLKLKRSFGHTVAISSLICAGALAIGGIATADPDAWLVGYTAAGGATAGLVAGAGIGAAVGSIVSGTVNRPVFHIQGKQENWDKIKATLSRYLPFPAKPEMAISSSK